MVKVSDVSFEKLKGSVELLVNRPCTDVDQSHKVNQRDIYEV